MNIIFCVEFNVEVRAVDYRRFIDDLRNRLAGDRVSHDRPVLRPQPLPNETTANERFQIVLRTSDSREIRLLFRPRNLYLDAYRMQNSDIWLEFSNPSSREHLIPGSTFLGFDGDYSSSHGLEVTAGRGRGETPLGRDSLRDAVNVLATSANSRDRARSLLVVIQMISESIRFEHITNFLLDIYFEGSSNVEPPRTNLPDDRILQLENSWGRLSHGLLLSDADPEIHSFPIRYMNGSNELMFTIVEAVAEIGMLLFKSVSKPSQLARIPNTNDDDSDNVVSEGRPLVEVFAVKINNVDGEDPGDLYGTVKVSDGEISDQYIYNRESGNTESIKPFDNARLIGPAVGAISASDDFIIDVALMDRDFISPDDEVSKGQIAWNVYHTNNIYDEPIFQEINGTNGSATVIYGVFSDAVQATIEVTLINGDGESPADVYGLLAASNTKFTGYESTLFRITEESGVSVEVNPGELIPLSRSIVAVPLNSDLIVRAHLMDRDSFPDPSSSDEIANGNVSFPAQLSGTFGWNISGKYGEIQVNVTWTP